MLPTVRIIGYRFGLISVGFFTGVMRWDAVILQKMLKGGELSKTGSTKDPK
jgi:hypothetical protein